MARLDFERLADSLAEREGLHRSSSGTVFGQIDGQPVHVGMQQDGNGNPLLAVIVATTSRAAAEETRSRWVEAIPDVKKGMVVVEDEAVSARMLSKKAEQFGPGELEALIVRLVGIAAETGRVMPSSSRGRPAIVNGVPRYISESEAGELSFAGQQVAAEYEDLRPRLGLGLVGGVLAMIVSALVWAGIAVLTDREFWLVAIGAGLLIGYVTLLAVGKTNLGIQVLIGVLTVASVFLGQILTVAWVLNDQFVGVDTGSVLSIYGSLLSDEPGTALFALGGGLFGAWYGAKLARKPQIEPEIEIAPAI